MASQLVIQFILDTMTTPPASAQKRRKKLMAPEKRFALDCEQVILAELVKILEDPHRYSQINDQSIATTWWNMMFEPYIRKQSALVGCDVFENRVRNVILFVVGYMVQHVEPGEPGQAKRDRFCVLIQHYLEHFSRWPWSQDMMRSWHPSYLGKTGKGHYTTVEQSILEEDVTVAETDGHLCTDFFEPNPDCLQKSLADQTASFECLLDDMEDKIDWERLITHGR